MKNKSDLAVTFHKAKIINKNDNIVFSNITSIKQLQTKYSYTYGFYRPLSKILK